MLILYSWVYLEPITRLEVDKLLGVPARYRDYPLNTSEMFIFTEVVDYFLSISF